MARNLIEEIVERLHDGDTPEEAVRQVCGPYGPIIFFRAVTSAKECLCFVQLHSPTREHELRDLVRGQYFGRSVCFRFPIPPRKSESSLAVN